MITTPGEYEFVDFGGTLPTAGFGGHIMPLRADWSLPSAEDIAFLAECVRDKAGAFRGITFGETSPVGSCVEDYVGRFKPGCVPTGSQFTARGGLWWVLNWQLGRGLPESGNGYLKSKIDSERVKTEEVGDRSIITATTEIESDLWDGIVRDYGGGWAPTAREAEFARHSPPLASSVMKMYDDARKLVRPVFVGDANSLESEFVAMQGSYSGQTSRLSYTMDKDRGYFGHGLWEDGQTLVAVPDTFVSDVQVWLFYVATNMVYRVKTGDAGASLSFAQVGAGLVCLADTEDQDSTIRFEKAGGVWRLPVGRDAAQKVIDLVAYQHDWERFFWEGGWPDVSGWPDGYVQDKTATSQQINVLWSDRLIVTGTPNGRTQWW